MCNILFIKIILNTNLLFTNKGNYSNGKNLISVIAGNECGLFLAIARTHRALPFQIRLVIDFFVFRLVDHVDNYFHD